MLRAQPAPTLEFRMPPRPLRAPGARASQQTAEAVPSHQRVLGQTRTEEPGAWRVASHSLPGGRPTHEAPLTAWAECSTCAPEPARLSLHFQKRMTRLLLPGLISNSYYPPPPFFFLIQGEIGAL